MNHPNPIPLKLVATNLMAKKGFLHVVEESRLVPPTKFNHFVRHSPIVAAAIYEGDQCWLGVNHAEIIKQMIMDGAVPPVKNNQQGFINAAGEFLNRELAAVIAAEFGQIIMSARRAHPNGIKKLCSEDLWKIEPHPEDEMLGELMTVEDFMRSVKHLVFTPDDGLGCWATETHVGEQTSVFADGGLLMPAPWWATHVMWYNK